MMYIDRNTGWFEIVEVPSVHKTLACISGLFKKPWLNRYPRPKWVLFDNGSGFNKDFILLRKNFGVKPQPTALKTPNPT